MTKKIKNKCLNCGADTENNAFCSRECVNDYSFRNRGGYTSQERKQYMIFYQIRVEQMNSNEYYLGKW